MQPASKQTRDDRRRLLANLPEGAKRVQVKAPDGRMQYKHPSDVDVDLDEILLASDGSPIIMRGNPGRRPKTVLKPVNPQTAQVAEARDDHITANPLVSSAKDNPEGDAVLDAIVIAMAEEAAAVEFERMEAERHGEPTSNISAKRARILKGMADTYLKRREKMDSLIDLDSPAFKRCSRSFWRRSRTRCSPPGLARSTSRPSSPSSWRPSETRVGSRTRSDG